MAITPKGCSWLFGDAAGDGLSLVDTKDGRVIDSATYRDEVGEPWCTQQFAGVIHVDPSNVAAMGVLCSGEVCGRLRRPIPDGGGRLLPGAAGLVDAGIIAVARDKVTAEAVIAVGDVGGFREVRRYDDPSRMAGNVKAVQLPEGILLVGATGDLVLLNQNGRPQQLELTFDDFSKEQSTQKK